MASTWGENIKLSIFGGSHTEAIGVVLDNLPPNEKIDMEKNSRADGASCAGQDKTATTRLEADEPQVLSGLFNGVTQARRSRLSSRTPIRVRRIIPI